MEHAVAESMLEKVQKARVAAGTAEVWLSLCSVKYIQEVMELRPVAFPDPFEAIESSHQERWVLWEADAPFSVQFQGRSPIAGPPTVHAVFDESTNRFAAAGKVLPDAASPDQYKYGLAMLAENTILMVDPGGIVRGDPT